MRNALGCAMLCVVGLAVGAAAPAGPVPGPLAPPAWVNITVNDEVDIYFDWTDVAGAAKYSLDVEATVTYIIMIGGEPVQQTMDIELSFGTSDRTDGGAMGDSDLTVLVSDFADYVAALIAAQGGDPTAVIEMNFDAMAKVKGLNPPGARQNNQFSPWRAFTFTWHPPVP